VKPQDGTLLSDDTLLSDVVLTGRSEHVASRANIKTIGELRKASDSDLRSLPECGKTTLLEFRLLTGQYTPDRPTKSDQRLKAEWIREIAGGHCTCSFEDWRKDKNNAAG